MTCGLNGSLHEMARDTLSGDAVGQWFRRDRIDRLGHEQSRGARDNGMKLFWPLCFCNCLEQGW